MTRVRCPAGHTFDADLESPRVIRCPCGLSFDPGPEDFVDDTRWRERSFLVHVIERWTVDLARDVIAVRERLAVATHARAYAWAYPRVLAVLRRIMGGGS
jgi:hypothetical protein